MKCRIFLHASGLLALFLASGCDVNPAERNNAGNAFFAQGRYEEALEAYQAAQVAAPDQPEPYYNAGNALASARRLQSAAAALRQALKTADSPLAAQAYHNLGNIYFDLARYDEAVAAYREALRRRPDDAGTRHNYELALLRLLTSTPPPTDSSSEPPFTPTPNPQPEQNPTESEPSADEGGPTPTLVETERDTPVETAAPPDAAGMSRAEAEAILDAVQQSQRTLGQASDAAAPSGASEEDW